MTTKVEKSILVNVAVSVAYNQWTQFEEFPRFMSGVEQVTQLDDDQLEWVAEIMGVRRQWKARILGQVPDQKVAWAATEGATNAGSVTFEDVGGGRTSVHLSLEYEPEGLVEGLGDKLHIVERQAEGDLDRFKTFIEAEGNATGAWRGSINAKRAADDGQSGEELHPPTEPARYATTRQPTEPMGANDVFPYGTTEQVKPVVAQLDPERDAEAETSREDPFGREPGTR